MCKESQFRSLWLEVKYIDFWVYSVLGKSEIVEIVRSGEQKESCNVYLEFFIFIRLRLVLTQNVVECRCKVGY